MAKKVIMKKEDLARKVKRLASEILDDAHGDKNLVLIGIRSKGVYLAERIQSEIKKYTGKKIPLGILDITLYRDDFSRHPIQTKIKETIINFDLTGKLIVLVDDVIWSGRTIRAALDQIIDFGRPEKVRLCVLIDRGGRELPIEPNFVGAQYSPRKNELIELHSFESDGKDEVVVVTQKNK
ncbi:MAG: bifunctional pyr operon transcriptional regulator/uracil phosphoribosyltransferase PyrR [Candidatus Omnitrophica bacterium]|nr:bifunctional pyr operon transcriptional regulator/uracil phosphoribosyltransferase PyrR [Candidatus Omnitrophota bacterium]